MKAETLLNYKYHKKILVTKSEGHKLKRHEIEKSICYHLQFNTKKENTKYIIWSEKGNKITERKESFENSIYICI